MLKKLALGGVGLLMLATPMLASALTFQETIAALQTQLQNIMTQITTLLAGSSDTGTGSDADYGSGSDETAADSSSCVNISRNLLIGDEDEDSGGDVEKLQRFLVAEGNLVMPAGRSFGTFGTITWNAVKSFQTAQNITLSESQQGTVEETTRAKIAELTGCSSTEDGGGAGSENSAALPSVSASVSGFTVTANYSNLPAHSYIELVKFVTNNVVDDDFATGISGSGHKATSTVDGDVYFLRIKKEVSGSTNPTIAQSATFSVGQIEGSMPPVTVEVSNGGVTATYEDLPQHSYFQVVNLANGNVAEGFATVPPNPGISGNGAQRINSIPTGTYFLRVKQYVSGADPAIAQSASFTIGATNSGNGGIPSVTADPYSQTRGWFTRTGGTQTTPYAGVRQTVIRWNGTTVYDKTSLNSGPITVGGYTYTPGTYIGSAYGWDEDYSNAFAVTRRGGTSSTCNREVEFQKCLAGAWAARFGNNCEWTLCPLNSGNGNSALAPVIRVNGTSGTGNPPDLNIASGAKAHISWEVKPVGSTCNTSDGTNTDANVPLTFDGDIGPYTTSRTFSMTCTNMFGTVSKTLRVNVGAATSGDGSDDTGGADATAPTITSFISAAVAVASGRSTNLSWAVTPATSVCWMKVNDGNETSVRPTNSNFNTGNLTADSKYTLTCHPSSNPDASETKDVSIKVVSATLTANGSHSISAAIDSPIEYVWESKNADIFDATYTSDRCGSASWKIFLEGHRTPGYTLAYSGNAAKGTRTDKVHGNQAGCTYTITYTAKDSASGITASDSVREVMGTYMPVTDGD